MSILHPQESTTEEPGPSKWSWLEKEADLQFDVFDEAGKGTPPTASTAGTQPVEEVATTSQVVTRRRCCLTLKVLAGSVILMDV